MDMENPLFWSRPCVRPSNYRGIPVYSPEQRVQSRKQPVKMSSSNTSKVVQIPVHFVGSESSHSASALKIQKVFRGFLVRRSMKRIIAIKRDVDEIERRISRSETLELIRKDERERLRVNEMLMALLLKLDSVRGVDSGVRECRRAVIKKAIALQERVDAVVSAADQSEVQISDELKDGGQPNADGGDQTLESTGSAGESSSEYGNQIETSSTVNFDHGPLQSSQGKDAGQLELLHDLPDSANPVADNHERVEVGDDLEMNAEKDRRAEETIDEEFGAHTEMKVEEEKNEVVDTPVQHVADLGRGVKEGERSVGEEIGESCHKTPAESEFMEESMETSQMETLTEGVEVNDVSQGEEEKGRTDDNRGNRELLERMMEDNEKMMKLMSQLCERNEMQTRMLNSLTQRVEQLEKAFVCHRLRRKKGRHSA